MPTTWTRLAPPAVAVIAAVTLAGCTSSGDDDPSVTPGPTSRPGSTATSTTPAAPSSTAANPLAALDGAYVVAGGSEDAAKLYHVRAGRLAAASDVAAITGVTVDGDDTGDHVVVSRAQRGQEVVQQLRSGRVVDLGIRSGFSPALSDDGALAWASLAGAASTPGVTKPKGFVVHVRGSLTGTDRDLATFSTSVGGLAWADDDLIAAVADGSAARIVRFTGGRGTAETVARVADADDLRVTAGDDAITVATNTGVTVVTLRDGRRHAFARGWQPLCWADDNAVLAANGGRLAVVPVAADGTPGTPRAAGSLPAGTTAFAGACGD
ncbi:hypothetical protein SAMN05443575_2279 [Jatrophihabitans endophyticus]|uniref:Uncharacterized protein n=1 Tax=Jatrophihabitans endophyticus TaxID=1206085 RepID=A0A1M5KWI7_9ACTN|nr:hypothetical protein [Jatrophihabitans endophyticus]SHG57030.1 hypothetical protein SAMN05443575_2279 [Jatrophihabitans endophyticus]